MAIHYNTRTVTDGLVLYLDSSNPRSYAGSGTTWNDLSKVIGNVNVQNRSTDWSFANDPETNIKCLYNNSNRVSGNSPGIDIPMNNGFNKAAGTIDMWLKPTDMTGGHGWFNNSDGSSYTNIDKWMWFGTWEGCQYVFTRFSSPTNCCHDLATSEWLTTYVANKWINISLTWSLSINTVTMYVNGAQFMTRNNLPTDISLENNTNIGQLFNGHSRGDNMQFKGYCSTYKIYNRSLSSTEIQKNFDSLRSRHNK